MKMNNVEFAPLRSLDDFLLESARFQTPNYSDLERWGKRVKENLIYYQTNYFLLSILIFLIVGLMHPGQMLLGVGTVGGLLVLYNYLARNQRVVTDLKKNHPVICLVAVFLAGYLVVHLLGSVLVFIFGVLLPISVTFIHASLRLRNLKNKIANQLDKAGVKVTPMGILLDEFGMAFEGYRD
jgi:hypothetical protein